MRVKTDFLVIGSGLAGLTMAIKASKYGEVILLSKGTLDDNNTVYAQGGIAAVTSPHDSFEQHIKDTMIAGAGMSDEEVVRKVVTAAPPYINELVEMGTHFDKLKTGDYELAKEGGHSKNRILHHKDNTGYEIHRALVEEVKRNPAITLYEEKFAIDLITQYGATGKKAPYRYRMLWSIRAGYKSG